MRSNWGSLEAVIGQETRPPPPSSLSQTNRWFPLGETFRSSFGHLWWKRKKCDFRNSQREPNSVSFNQISLSRAFGGSSRPKAVVSSTGVSWLRMQPAERRRGEEERRTAFEGCAALVVFSRETFHNSLALSLTHPLLSTIDSCQLTSTDTHAHPLYFVETEMIQMLGFLTFRRSFPGPRIFRRTGHRRRRSGASRWPWWPRVGWRHPASDWWSGWGPPFRDCPKPSSRLVPAATTQNDGDDDLQSLRHQVAKKSHPRVSKSLGPKQDDVVARSYFVRY